jgi:flagellar biosynthesis protein FliQ
MNQGIAISILNQGITLLLRIVLPIIGTGLLVGLSVALFQAITQIQEQTLTFVPKMVIVMVMIMVLAPWMFSLVVSFVIQIWGQIPIYAR